MVKKFKFNTKKEGILILAVIIFTILVGMILADLLDTAPSSYSVNETLSNLYNITINNTNNPSGINFTQVNITFHSNFTISNLTNGTSSTGKLVIDGQTLSWTNNTNGFHLVTNGTLEYFWVNAIANENSTGEYNITITTLDTSSETNSSDISVTVNALSPTDGDLSIEFTAPTPSDDANLSQSYIPVKVTAEDDVAIDTIIVYLYNSTDLLNSTTSFTSPYFVNFTNLPDETYYINATVNNTLGNTSSTTTRTIILSSTILCTPDWHCTNWSACINGIQIRSCVDFNTCGIPNEEYPENQSCDCTPDWFCTEWQPKKCPKNETQTRTCEDLNNCGIPNEEYPENQSCTYESKANLLLIFIVVIVVIPCIIGVIILLIIRSKNKNFGKTNSSNQGFGGYPPPPRTSPRPPRGSPPLQRRPVRRPVRRYLPQKPRSFQSRPRYSNKYP